ncbi:MAG: adenosylmethionine decarboxylase [bacterium]|jgi:S-adenosylmethionine decarboxylase
MALNIIYRGKNVYAPQVLAKPIALEDELERKDHFTVKNGVTCAGTHLIIDLWDASQLDDLSRMESALREAVDVCGATLLHIHLHHFTPNGGISGVAVLAESHISVHSWPERGFAAFDAFMCGDAQPELAVDVFRRHFMPSRVEVQQHLRGTVGSHHGAV